MIILETCFESIGSDDILSKRLRIAFVADWDASDPDAMSGASFFMRRAFLALGHDVIDVFPASHSFGARILLGPGYLFKKFFASRGLYYSPKRNKLYVAAVSRFTSRVIKANGPLDLIFSQSSYPVGDLDTNIPMIMTADQPFEQYLIGYTPNAAPRFATEGRALESKVAAKVKRYIFPSEWAKAAFSADHPELKHLVQCVPWGGNLNVEPTDDLIEKDISRKSTDNNIQILFMGRDWQRKRGALVLDTLDLLRDRGFSVNLDIVGAGDVSIGSRSGVRVISSVSKNTQAGWDHYESLLRGAHFLFVPSMVEAYGHVFCEASAYGVPSVSTSIGGIPTIIEDGKTGICLPLTASASEYANAISNVLDGKQYTLMARAARHKYRDGLSWKSFAEQALKPFGPQ